mgnify:CR=1 FL=1
MISRKVAQARLILINRTFANGRFLDRVYVAADDRSMNASFYIGSRGAGSLNINPFSIVIPSFSSPFTGTKSTMSLDLSFRSPL